MTTVKVYGQTGVEVFDSEAEALCLSFANTADWHASAEPKELLNSYGDLLTWARLWDVVSEEEAAKLAELAGQEPAAARKTLEKAVFLRETMYRLFVAVARGRPLPQEDVAILNAALPDVLTHLRLILAPAGLAWGWAVEASALERVIWPVLRSAADLLTSGEVERIGQCADDRGCGWLFLDKSRNRSRRWCSMARCGNRDKARRHYRRLTGKI